MSRTFFRKPLALFLTAVLVLSQTPTSLCVKAQEADAAAAAPVTANWYTSYQTMDGVGAAYAYTDSVMMMQLAQAGHQDTVQHLLDLAFSAKNGTGHDIVRVIIGDGATTATGTKDSPGYNPATGLLADVNNPGYDVKGNAIPMRGTAGQYGYKVGAYNRIYDGQTDSIWPNEPAHDPGTLVPVKDFIWENSSWNQAIANDEGGPTNNVNTKGDPVVIKNSARTRKELFDVDQVWTMKQAMKYGVHQFYACMWEAPYWMSSGNNNQPSKIIRTDTAVIDGKNVKIYYQAYADYLVNYIKGMWEQYGIPITQINPFNELDLASNDANLVKELIDQYIGPTLKKSLEPGGTLDGIKNPDGKVINFTPELAALDGCNLNGQLRLGASAFSETEPDNCITKNKYLDIFTTHLYGTVGIGTDETKLTHTGDFAEAPLDYNKDGAKYPEYLTHGYKLWETEFMNQDTGDGSAGAYTQRYGNNNINDAVRYANLMTNMFCSNPGFTGYLWWSMWDSNGADGSDLIRFVHTNSQQNPSHVGSLTGEYRAFKRLYGLGHFSRFMNPGDTRFDVTRVPAKNINIVGFKSADNKDFSMTVTNGNNDDSVQRLEFSLKGFPVGTKSVTVFRTSGSENQKKLASIPVTDGKFVIDIPAASIVTIVPSDGNYATYNGLDSERDIFSSLEAEGNDNSLPGDTAGNAGRAKEAVALGDGKYLAYKNLNFADGSANGGVVRRHLLYLTAQSKSTAGGSLLAYTLPVGTAVSSTSDIISKGTRVAEILVPRSTDYGKYQSMVDTGDNSAYGHKDLYIVAATNASSDTITVDRFLFGANDSDWSTAANNSTVTIPGNVLANGDFDTTTSSDTSNWSAGRYNNGTFEQSVTGPTLAADTIQRYSGYSRYLKNSKTSTNAGSAKISGRINDTNKYDGMWQDVTGKLTKGERYNFEGYFLSMKNGPLGYDIASENPGEVQAAIVYYDKDGKQLDMKAIGGRKMPEPYAAREAGERAWWNGNTLVGSILEGGPLSINSFQPVDVKIADWHESDKKAFIYDEPSGTAKVVLALYAKDSNIFYADQLSLSPEPDRQALRDALKAFKGQNQNIANVVKDALVSSSLTQATVSKLITALQNDSYPEMSSLLAGIKVDGKDISNFKSDTLNYNMVYPIGGTPNITVDKFDPSAQVEITPAKSIPGQATIKVTSGEKQTVYAINFTIDTALSSIKVGGSPLISFKSDVNSYTIRIPEGTTGIPAIQAVAKDPGAKVEVTAATAIPGEAKVTVSYDTIQTVYTVKYMKDITGSDEFNGTELDKTFWHWVNEDSNNWSLTKNPGSMNITTHKGDIYATSTDMKNILLQNAPGDWTMETKVTASKRPAVAYQQGGLIAYQDMDNYIKLDWVAASATNTSIQVNREINGAVSSTSVDGKIVSIDSNTVWLRMTKSGNNYTVYYSTDGSSYTQLGSSYALNLKNVQAGISASNGGGSDTADFNMSFDYFHTTAQIGELMTNKADLIDQINNAQAKNQNDYTADTWANLQTELKKAIDTRDNLNAKQSEINASCDSLKNAISALIKISITSIDDITANIEEGQKYTLPATVTAIYSDGNKKEVSVKWNPASTDTSKAGTYIFKGTVEGYAKEITLTLTVNAKPIVISSIENITAGVEEGQAYTLPSKVTATYSDGTKKEIPVKWDPASVDTSKAGTYTFKGSVEGYNKELTLTLTVNAKPIVILSIDNITASVTVGENYALPSKVTAAYSDGTKKEVSVKWDSAAANTSKAGTYTFKGTVEGYDKEVVLTLTVNSKPATTPVDNNAGNGSGKTDDSSAPAPTTTTPTTTPSPSTSTIVNAKNNPVVSKDVFNELKGKDKNIRIEANNVVWEFNGKDINSTVTSDIDFSLRDVSSDLKNKEIAKVKSVLGKEVPLAPFSFKHDGPLPGAAKVTLSIDTSFSGKTVDIYRYFADKNTYEYVTEAAADSNGYITISLNHCSDYFAIEKTNAIKMPKTGSVIDFNVLVASGLILSILGLAVMNKKRIRRYMGK